MASSKQRRKGSESSASKSKKESTVKASAKVAKAADTAPAIAPKAATTEVSSPARNQMSKAAANLPKVSIANPVGPLQLPPSAISLAPHTALQHGIVEVLRPSDLLSLWIEFRNLRLDRSNPKRPKIVPIVSKGVRQPAHLIVWVAPQSILEHAYFEVGNVASQPTFNHGAPNPPGTTDNPPAPGTVPAYISNYSRLVFRVPPNIKEIPYTIEALLDWSKLDLVVSPLAQGKKVPPPITAPGDLQTAIELPWRVVLSPGKDAGWVHSPKPETYRGRTALWHTRLGNVREEKSGKTARKIVAEASVSNTVPIRAIWSPDFVDHGVIPPLSFESPFRASLNPGDRMQLVILTAGSEGYFIGGNKKPWEPKPIQASRFFLSSLGGYLTSRGEWPTPVNYQATVDGQPETQTLDLTEWVHVATLARDHYVKVVYAGYLYPFGHRASLIKVTERKPVPPDGINVNQVTAYLRQHMYVVVREPVKTFRKQPFQFDRRELPFWRSIRIKTTVTPDIDPPVMIPGGTPPHVSFWITVNNANFDFHLTATDLAGKQIDFTTPLIFMTLDEPDLAGLQTAYATSGDARKCTVNGQKVAYAAPSEGDTTLKTNELTFTTEIIQPKQPYSKAPFLPVLDQATVSVPAVEEILGLNEPLTIALYQPYLSGGMDKHAGVFADVVNNQPNLTFSAEQAGGLGTPNLTLKALSARKGLIAGSAADAAAGLIDPGQFFTDLKAQLFGTIPLSGLIPVDGSGKAPADKNAPEIRTVLTPNHTHPTAAVTKVQWSPQLQNYSQPPLQVQFDQNGAKSALNLKTVLTRSLTGAAPQSLVTGSLTNFRINLLGVIELTINSLKFTSKNGQKMMVNASLPSSSPVQFVGTLSFVQALANVLPPGIFGGKGPSIDLGKSEIKVSYTLGLPPVSIGVFSLENISITTGLDLPYLDGKPGFEFAFAKRNSPFLLTVECLGGGGFVHLIVTAEGVQMVEGALEFGGEFSFDVGIASGGVHVMAGIYFQLTGTSSDLTGFVDIGGEVSVLGIISISIDLNLSLSYQTSNGKSMVQGRATLSISVHILFFSVSASVSVEKSFGSQPGDPGVAAMLTKQNWSDYAAAFA